MFLRSIIIAWLRAQVILVAFVRRCVVAESQHHGYASATTTVMSTSDIMGGFKDACNIREKQRHYITTIVVLTIPVMLCQLLLQPGLLVYRNWIEIKWLLLMHLNFDPNWAKQLNHSKEALERNLMLPIFVRKGIQYKMSLAIVVS